MSKQAARFADVSGLAQRARGRNTRNKTLSLTAQMRPAQMANQNGLAGSGGKEVEEHGLGLVPLAGFEVTTEERGKL